MANTMLKSLPLWVLAAMPAVYGQGNTDNGNIAACKSQSCTDCPVFASVNEQFPDCITYPSAGNLDGYDTENGNGYRVWWNSGQPEPSCQIIVRTPASTTLPACGYYLTGWQNAGCYYTLIQESFMLQYCCGTGNCDEASPVSTAAEARTMSLQGFTAIASLQFDNMTSFAQPSKRSGKRSFDDIGVEVHWEDARVPMASSQLAKYTKRQGDSCSYAQTQKYTKGGPQQRVSTTQNCNTEGGCSIAIDTTVTSGRTVSVNAGFNLFEIISLGTDIQFTEEMSRSLTNTFTQDVGTRGYVSFIPTYECTFGDLSSCDGLSDGTVEACTPRLIGDFNDGTYSFVYVAPGQG